jgi:hypothetical protein
MNGVQLPHDIEDVIAAPAGSSWLIWAAVALAMVLLAIIWWWRRKKLKPVEIESPTQQLLRRLSAHKIEEPFERNAQRLWAFELSSLLRSAAEIRWHIPATDRTTDELVVELRKSSTASESTQQNLIGILRRLDQVQFADVEIEKVQAEQVHEQTTQLIQQLIGGTS